MWQENLTFTSPNPSRQDDIKQLLDHRKFPHWIPHDRTLKSVEVEAYQLKNCSLVQKLSELHSSMANICVNICVYVTFLLVKLKILHTFRTSSSDMEDAHMAHQHCYFQPRIRGTPVSGLRVEIGDSRECNWCMKWFSCVCCCLLSLLL